MDPDNSGEDEDILIDYDFVEARYKYSSFFKSFTLEANSFSHFS